MTLKRVSIRGEHLRGCQVHIVVAKNTSVDHRSKFHFNFFRRHEVAKKTQWNTLSTFHAAERIANRSQILSKSRVNTVESRLVRSLQKKTLPLRNKMLLLE